MSLNNRASLLVGFALIVLGVLFLLQQFFNWRIWDTLWPVIVIAAGGLFFAGMAAGGKAAGPLAIPGSIITVSGAMLFVFNLIGRWEAWAYSWGLIVAAVGLGLVIFGWWSDLPGLRRSGFDVIRVGLSLFVIFGFLFEVLFFRSVRVGDWIFPALLIVLGVWLLVRRSGWWDRLFPPSAPRTPASQVTLDASGRPVDDQSQPRA
ncbi:MAG: hypothetical protein IT317_10270 [Anaerolineales bacterium]|nr:hypothetical protein [Anaerolineales bacterium]